MFSGQTTYSAADVHKRESEKLSAEETVINLDLTYSYVAGHVNRCTLRSVFSQPVQGDKTIRKLGLLNSN